MLSNYVFCLILRTLYYFVVEKFKPGRRINFIRIACAILSLALLHESLAHVSFARKSLSFFLQVLLFFSTLT